MHLSRFASLFSLALWWGSLTTLGFIVVPMLFAHMDTMQAAGRMAAKLFNVQAYVSLGCAAVLIVAHWGKERRVMVCTVLALAASLAVQWLVAPQIMARDNLRLWHGVGTGLYIVQWGCTSVLLWWRSRLP
jgi:Domain of unknown function (DUF4149)